MELLIVGTIVLIAIVYVVKKFKPENIACGKSSQCKNCNCNR